MIFHENCLLVDNSHEISYLIFSTIRKMSQNLSSAAVVIGALRVKACLLANKALLPEKYWGIVNLALVQIRGCLLKNILPSFK